MGLDSILNFFKIPDDFDDEYEDDENGWTE